MQQWLRERATRVTLYYESNLVFVACYLTRLSTAKSYVETAVSEWMGMGHWWNDTDRGKRN